MQESKDSEVKVVCKGIEIKYDENSNCWNFELRNLERSAETLLKAKQAIDKPTPGNRTARPRNPDLRPPRGRINV
jgi:hypothetical protein